MYIYIYIHMCIYICVYTCLLARYCELPEGHFPSKPGFVRPPQVPPLKLWEIPRWVSTEAPAHTVCEGIVSVDMSYLYGKYMVNFT